MQKESQEIVEELVKSFLKSSGYENIDMNELDSNGLEIKSNYLVAKLVELYQIVKKHYQIPKVSISSEAISMSLEGDIECERNFFYIDGRTSGVNIENVLPVGKIYFSKFGWLDFSFNVDNILVFTTLRPIF